MTVEVLGALKQIALVETYIDPVTQTIKVNDSFPICPSFGAVWYRSVDFGFPDVRASAQDNPQADGTFDETRYTGARSITIEGVVIGDGFGDYPTRFGWPSDVQWNSSSWFISLLSAWALPSRRFRFYWTDEILRSRFMDVRGDDFSADIAKNSEAYREFQLGLICPSGKAYSFSTGQGSTEDGRFNVPIALDDSGEDGRSYPETGPYTRNYPPGSVAYSAIKYGGTVPNGCTIQIYTGGATMQAPRVVFTAPNGTTSSIGLSAGLTIAAHTTLTFDTISRTVTTRGDNASASVNVAQYLAAPLQWPQLRPGINRTATEEAARARGYNRIDFTSGSAASDASMTVLYHEADIL